MCIHTLMLLRVRTLSSTANLLNIENLHLLLAPASFQSQESCIQNVVKAHILWNEEPFKITVCISYSPLVISNSSSFSLLLEYSCAKEKKESKE